MRYTIGQLNIYVFTLAYKIRSSSGAVSRVADSEAGLCWFETRRRLIFFLQIIFLHLSPLLLTCISEVFDVSRLSRRGSFTYKILSNETVDPYLKYFTYNYFEVDTFVLCYSQMHTL